MKKNVGLLSFALIVLIMNWEAQSWALPQGKPIPEESIRLRIIANSDSPQDQWLKRRIRDRLVNDVKTWVGSMDDMQTARKEIRRHMEDVKRAVRETVKENGFTYATKVKLGDVSFPTKKYGAYVYPAGTYEAVKVTIGRGEGQNWWCVLFPPLCFVDMSKKDAVPANTKDAEASELGSKVEVSFLLVEMWNKIRSFFAA